MAKKLNVPEGTDNFEQNIIDNFKGYVSSIDPTKAAPNMMVRGSVNVYKKISGTIANRPGKKQYDALDTTIAGVNSSFVWNTSLGSILPLRVSNSKFQVLSNITGSKVWYTLQSGVTLTRYVFDTIWDNTLKKDFLVFVRGSSDLFRWDGGIGVISAVTNAASNNLLSIIGNSASLTQWVAPSGTASFSYQNNGLLGSSMVTLVEFSANPTDGQTFIININGSLINFQFVSIIGAVAGNVLIGATLKDTINNLAGLLTTPGSTNATQVALSGGNQTLVGYLTSTAPSNTIKLTTTVATSGFVTTGDSVVINGNTYSYSGSIGPYLTGVGSDATGEAVGSVVISAITTNALTPASGFTNDFVKTINNQLYVGSYTSRLIYISKNDNYIDYTQATPRIPGDGDLLTLDNSATGITVKDGEAWISAGTSDWYKQIFVQITVGTTLTEQNKVEKQPVPINGGAYAHEFIEVVNNTIVYLSQDQQLRTIGLYRNINQPAYPALSQEIFDELQDEDFTLGHLKAIGDFIYLVAPNAGRVYLHQTRSGVDTAGNVVSERLWHAPFIWGISRIDSIDGDTVGFSNSNPQLYYLWDTNQWHDDSPFGENLPYSSTLILGYQNGGRRQGKINFDKMYYEGYVAGNLYEAIYYDYQGSENILSSIINSSKYPATLYTGSLPPSLGDASLGDNPLGSGLNTLPNDQALLPKFRVIIDKEQVDCFEFAVLVYSSEKDSRWELIALGANITLSTALPVEITKSD